VVASLNDNQYHNFLAAMNTHIGHAINNPGSGMSTNQANGVKPSGVMTPLVRHPSNSQSPGKRHLPVAQKQMIYNEWGAVIKHQDEVDQALKMKERMDQKDQQAKYRQDLEEQKEMMERKLLEQKMKDAELENDVLKFQQAKEKLRALEEQRRIGRYRDQLIAK
jgi:septal ring factor EnvC (AmiA/AmiB activator)